MGRITATQFYTIDEVRKALGVSTKTVRRRISEGELVAHRIGRQIRISADDYQAFIALQRRQRLSS